MNTNELLNDSKALANTQDILKDLLQRDPEALKKFDSMGLDMNAIKTALDFLSTNDSLDEKDKINLLNESWRINFKAKPPTPEEFITEKYLGPAANSTFPWIKKIFKEFMDPQQAYRNLILYPHVGFGKSYLSTIITLYIATHLNLMRNPWKYFGLNPATQISQMLVSYSLKKSSELLLEPFLSLLEASPFFERVQRQDSMKQLEEEFKHQDTVDKLYWTTAYPTSALGFSSGSTIKIASNPGGLLGLTIVSIVYSELAFFTDAGKALSLDERIVTDRGVKTMGEILVGDRVLSPTGDFTEVIDIPWQGTGDLYEITVEDGRTVKCHWNHLWPVHYINEYGDLIEDTVTTGFMIEHPEFNFELISI